MAKHVEDVLRRGESAVTSSRITKANRVGDTFRRAMNEGLGDMHRLNSDAEDEQERTAARS